MVTGKSQPGIEPVQLPPTSPDPVASNSPPSRRDLASWWRQFKRNTRKEELKESSQCIAPSRESLPSLVPLFPSVLHLADPQLSP
ncbi:unnamed protein product [Penicillium pancosmium]